MTSPNILIFNGRLLSASETFVKAQAEGLQRFVPYYVGARRVKGLPIPPDRTLVVNSGNLLGSISEVMFKQTGFAPDLVRKLKNLQPVLLHAHFGVCGTLALPLAKQINVPLIVTYHGFDASMTDEYARKNSISTQVYLRRREALKQKATLFIAVSEFIKTRLVKQGFPEDRIQVHYIGTDANHFQSDPAILRQRKILFVGRLVEKKGCEYLIRAMAQVQQVEPEVELIIIGEGPLRTALEAQAADSLKHYSFLGVQSPEQVKGWMNQCHLLVAPSMTTADGDTEGLPMVILEAQAMGLPVIGSHHAGIPEAILDGETGFLAAEQDWGAIAHYILRLLQDSDCWNRFSMNGQKHVRSQFNLSKQIEKLEALYHSVLIS